MSVPSTLVELWTGRKASIQHYIIWGYHVYVLKGKTVKLDIKSELCYVIGYSKGSKG